MFIFSKLGVHITAKYDILQLLLSMTDRAGKIQWLSGFSYFKTPVYFLKYSHLYQGISVLISHKCVG